MRIAVAVLWQGNILSMVIIRFA